MKSNRHVPLIMGLVSLGIASALFFSGLTWWKNILGAFLLVFSVTSFKTAFFASDEEMVSLTTNSFPSPDFRERTTAPHCYFTDDDENLIHSSDIIWWEKLSFKDFERMAKDDEATWITLMSHLIEQKGLSEEVAAKQVRRSLPFYYLNEDEKNNDKLVSDKADSKLPYLIKNRVIKAVATGKFTSEAISAHSSFNALARKLIVAGQI
jgi:hypothetical protein